MSILEILLGRGWGQRAVIIFALVLYLYLSFRKPTVALESTAQSLRTFVSLLTLIFAAMMIASAIENLIQPEAISGVLGKTAGLKGIFLGGFLGGLLPGGPYSSYPIIKSLHEGGAGLGAVMAMIIGWSIIGVGKVAYGLVFLGPKIVGLRFLLGMPALVVACLLAFFLL